MTSLIRLTMILAVISASAVAVIWWMGHAQPLSRDLLFTNPDGTPCTQPCLLGIRPGGTSQADAVAILRAHPLTRAMALNIEGDIFHDEGLGIILNRDMESRVTSIRLARRGPAASVPEAVIDQVVGSLGGSDLVIDNRLPALASVSPRAEQPIAARR